MVWFVLGLLSKTLILTAVLAKVGPVVLGYLRVGALERLLVDWD
ncbi:MAG: hypothetical protein ACRDFS_02640 [Chloroflexota bacterium]